MKTCEPSEAPMSEQLTLFPADTLASHLALPGNALAKKMTVTSGQSLQGSWLSSGPLGSVEKTLLGTSAWGSTTCFLTWKTLATKRGRLLFRLRASAPRTSEIASGLLPTPTAQTYGTNQGGAAGRVGKVRPSLETMARHGLWPTPSVKGNYNRKGLSEKSGDGLATAVNKSLWPTPGAADHRDRGNLGSPAIQRRAAKGKQLNLSMVVSDQSGALNPTWVEWLMGFPPGWTDLKPSETPSSRKSPS